jgi:pimeloyl-ACP methyl ester carboxylesterase
VGDALTPALPELRFAGLPVERLGLSGPRLSYFDTGEGEPVLLLHGIAAHAGNWRFTLEGLSRAGFRGIAWNMPGMFLTDPFASATPRTEDYVAVAIALADALGLARFHLVGSSFGSMLAICLAAAAPERVRTLSLLGASRGQRWKSAEDRAAMLEMRRASIVGGGLALAATRWSSLVAARHADRVGELVRTLLAAADAPGLLPAAAASDVADALDWAGEVRAPTLLVTGEEDVVNPPEVGRAITAAIPGARFVMPRGVGHLPEIEAPAETLALLLEHFARG